MEHKNDKNVKRREHIEFNSLPLFTKILAYEFFYVNKFQLAVWEAMKTKLTFTGKHEINSPEVISYEWINYKGIIRCVF